VCRNINFMQIQPLKKKALKSQLGIRGSVVNIPIDINDIIRFIPPYLDNMTTVQLKLKRYITHATDYMFESIRLMAILML